MKFNISPVMRPHLARIVDFFVSVVIVGAVSSCFAMLFAGCASPYLPADPAKMTPEQLKAIASDRNVSASCTTAGGPWGSGRTVYVQFDKGATPGGTVAVTQDCQVSFTAEQKGGAK